MNAHSPSNDASSSALWTQSSSHVLDGDVAAASTSPPTFKTPEKVDLRTGEENDKNVLQVEQLSHVATLAVVFFFCKVHCGLHVFDSKTHTWCERGRGLLRLNDMQHPNEDGTFQSRLGTQFKLYDILYGQP